MTNTKTIRWKFINNSEYLKTKYDELIGIIAESVEAKSGSIFLSEPNYSLIAASSSSGNVKEIRFNDHVWNVHFNSSLEKDEIILLPDDEMDGEEKEKFFPGVINHDSWHLVRNIFKGKSENTLFGVSHNVDWHNILYQNLGSQCSFRLDNAEFEKLSSCLKRCQKISYKCNAGNYWAKYTTLAVKTKHDAMILVSSLWDGIISLTFTLYDAKGKDYSVCGMCQTVRLNPDELNEFLNIQKGK
jgi:hypothetical protein